MKPVTKLIVVAALLAVFATTPAAAGAADGDATTGELTQFADQDQFQTSAGIDNVQTQTQTAIQEGVQAQVDGTDAGGTDATLTQGLDQDQAQLSVGENNAQAQSQQALQTAVQAQTDE